MRKPTILLTLLGLLWTATASGQLWRGPAALEVRAEGRRDRSIAGAEVKLTYLALEPPDGPAPVELDSKGRAVIGGLAEGLWRVEVSQEGYMTFQAELELRQDGKPDVVSTLQLNVPNAVHMMEVRFARARSAPAAQAAAAPAPSRPASETPSAPAPSPAPTRAPAQAPPAAAEPAPSRPEPAPAPPSIPAPEPATPPAQAPAPSPEPPSRSPATPPSPVPAPRVEPPAPAPAPEPVAPPAPTVRRRSFEDRTCFECKPGESALSVEQVVPAGEGAGACGEGIRDLLGRPDAAAGLPAGCRVLRIDLPAGVRYTGYRYEVQEGEQTYDCMAGKDCSAEAGRWPIDPVLARSETGTSVAAAFESRSSSRERRALLTVYYTAATTRRSRGTGN